MVVVVCVKIFWRWRTALPHGDSVTPAKAGGQESVGASWIPACAGMTRTVAIQSPGEPKSRGLRICTDTVGAAGPIEYCF